MVTPEVRSEIDTGPAPVSAAWIAPRGAVATLVVAHGAGAGMDHPFMAGFARAIAEHGVATLRFNFPYIERGRRSPDPEGVLRATWLAGFEDARSRSDGRPVLAGGKSLGGRIASMAAADGMPAAGLVFLGYPFHPPGKPERVRDDHLYRIAVPMLFIQGTADGLATFDMIQDVVRGLGAMARLHVIEGGDHSFRVRGKRRPDEEIGKELGEVASGFVKEMVG